MQGGRSAATAPLLSEGRYRDSVLAGDVRWYGFDLGPGDTLRATMSLTGGNVDTLTPFAQVQVELRSEDVLGDLRCDVASARELSDPAGQVRLGQEPMQIASHQIEPAGELCRAPGRYFVRVALIDDVRPTRLLRLRGIPGELQYDLSVEVSSSPEVQATTPEEPGAGTGDGGPSARPAGLQDPDMSMAVMAFAGFGFALAGFATGTAAGRRLVGSR